VRRSVQVHLRRRTEWTVCISLCILASTKFQHFLTSKTNGGRHEKRGREERKRREEGEWWFVGFRCILIVKKWFVAKNRGIMSGIDV